MRRYVSVGLVVLVSFAVGCSSSSSVEDDGGGGDGGVSQGGGGQGGQPQGSGGDGGVGGMGIGGDGQGGFTLGMPCTWALEDPCPTGMYCNAPGCGEGECEPKGGVDNPTAELVCGCDNVHYWNADTAAVFGMAIAASGGCSPQKSCGGIGAIPCPLVGHDCSGEGLDALECNTSDPGGLCWGMPQSCNSVGLSAELRLCDAPNGPCVDRCVALTGPNSGYYSDSTCP